MIFFIRPFLMPSTLLHLRVTRVRQTLSAAAADAASLLHMLPTLNVKKPQIN
jgi:hypothetical protein